MKVMLCGGGTGGHTTPLVAVADQLRAIDESVELVAVNEKTDYQSPLADNIPTYYVYSGKFRRYWGESWWSRLSDWRTLALNVRDVVKVGIGFFQAVGLLYRQQPDVIFIKGGYVSLPLGLAAKVLGIDYVTHDSDIVPGLTNRLLAPGAVKNLVAFPTEHYSYSMEKVIQTGLPVRSIFEGVTYKSARKKLNISHNEKRVVIIGGSSGAQAINYAAADISSDLAKLANVVHITGKGQQFIKTKALYKPHDNYKLVEYMYEDLPLQLAAADVVVTRAGATTLAELAMLRRCAVVVPHPLLTGGHQLKNAQAINSYDAGIILQQELIESDPKLLLAAIDELLDNSKRRQWHGGNLHQMFKANAAQLVAKVLTDVASS